MGKDWSRSALDDLYLSGVITRPTTAFEPAVPARSRNLGLPALCLLVGVIVALLYVWPVLIMTQIIAGGMRSVVFWPILAGSPVLAGSLAWAIKAYERGYWERSRHTLPDWADSPPWK
jgi:hypothetical protein